MNLICELDDIRPGDETRVGGKAVALARMAADAMAVPDAICLTIEAYQWFVRETGLQGRILLELNRKVFEEMRWEEIWDTALRIRHRFLHTPLPESLRAAILAPIRERFSGRAVVVRSSAPGEDAAGSSFAGLHDSFVNIQGLDSILDHIRLVWASLWSDRALLYRRELGLSTTESAMGVVVQAVVAGEVSGVAFGVSPSDPSQAVVEAVYGLNQGLVDGDVAPDAWILGREDGAVITHRPARRENAMRPMTETRGGGVHLVPLTEKERSLPPLSPEKVSMVFDLVRAAEKHFGVPQDVEWTFRDDRLFILQSRPVTAGAGADDSRAWYLSQHRSFENLKALARRVKEELLPKMQETAQEMASMDLSGFTDRELASEIGRRRTVYSEWKQVYWDEFIPLAHGIRLFGQVYNEAVQPEDPFAFVDLLKGTDMLSLRRNRMIREMAGMIRADDGLAADLASGELPAGGPFAAAFDRFMDRFGTTAWGSGVVQDRDRVIRMLLSLARLPEEGLHDAAPRRTEDMEASFLECFSGEARVQAREMLAVGRESYRLRDDDNIYLGRIEGHMRTAVEIGRRRLAAPHPGGDPEGRGLLTAALGEDDTGVPAPPAGGTAGTDDRDPSLKARQIVGQPAGPGLVRGRARIISGPDDLFDFQAGEILVCDAVDPNMTFLVPLAAGVVERRGGMLIHGAIIAREYGLPCVTGVPEAVQRIATGDEITVDGYLGIVIRHFALA